MSDNAPQERPREQRRTSRVPAVQLPPRLLNKVEAAEVLGTSRWGVRRLVISGELAVVRVNGSERISTDELCAFIERNTSRSEPTAAAN